MSDIRSLAPRLAGPRRRALAPVLTVGVAVASALALLPFADAAPRLVGLGLYALTAVLVFDGVGDHHPYARFGLGNGITLFRAGAACVLAALAIEPALAAGGAAWAVLLAAGVLLALDGIDGWAARRQGQTSAFGARFDMEVDALLILVLSALAAGLGKAGPWVIALGLSRYAFLLAGRLIPKLAQPLPPSQRRRVVCGLQVAALGLILAPPVVPPASEALAAAAFAALAWSFAVDIAWLIRQR
jgi:phosphatidylglycerophosphate synthase